MAKKKQAKTKIRCFITGLFWPPPYKRTPIKKKPRLRCDTAPIYYNDKGCVENEGDNLYPSYMGF